jgi:hypothetical protein
MNQVVLEKQPEPITVDPNEILTVQQAAGLLKVSYSHMLRLINGAGVAFTTDRTPSAGHERRAPAGPYLGGGGASAYFGSAPPGQLDRRGAQRRGFPPRFAANHLAL